MYFVPPHVAVDGGSEVPAVVIIPAGMLNELPGKYVENETPGVQLGVRVMKLAPVAMVLPRVSLHGLVLLIVTVFGVPG